MLSETLHTDSGFQQEEVLPFILFMWNIKKKMPNHINTAEYNQCTSGCKTGPFSSPWGIRPPFPSFYQEALCNAVRTPINLYNHPSQQQLGGLPPVVCGVVKNS
jgi:hypothetical protein